MRAYFLILFSFFVGMVLAVFPLPTMMDYVRPQWVAMTLIFWVLATPDRAGIILGFTIGLLLDVLEGHILGQSALALGILGYLCQVLYPRLRLYSPIQQSLMIFVLVGLYQLVHYWAESIIIGQAGSLLLLPALGSAVLWPIWHAALHWMRMTFRVQN